MITPFTPAIRNTNKSRILIVDDNPRLSQSAHLILQQSGQYVVCEEIDAASAVETARSFRSDLTQRIDGHRVLSKPVSSSNLPRIVEESLPCRAAA